MGSTSSLSLPCFRGPVSWKPQGTQDENQEENFLGIVY